MLSSGGVVCDDLRGRQRNVELVAASSSCFGMTIPWLENDALPIPVLKPWQPCPAARRHLWPIRNPEPVETTYQYQLFGDDASKLFGGMEELFYACQGQEEQKQQSAIKEAEPTKQQEGEEEEQKQEQAPEENREVIKKEEDMGAEVKNEVKNKQESAGEAKNAHADQDQKKDHNKGKDKKSEIGMVKRVMEKYGLVLFGLFWFVVLLAYGRNFVILQWLGLFALLSVGGWNLSFSFSIKSRLGVMAKQTRPRKMRLK